MRVTAIALLFILLGACAPIPTLDELQSEALQTGDWSEVERREKIMRVRQARSGPQCPDGATGYCEQSGGDVQCACYSTDVLRSSMARNYSAPILEPAGD